MVFVLILRILEVTFDVLVEGLQQIRDVIGIVILICEFLHWELQCQLESVI